MLHVLIIKRDAFVLKSDYKRVEAFRYYDFNRFICMPLKALPDYILEYVYEHFVETLGVFS